MKKAPRQWIAILTLHRALPLLTSRAPDHSIHRARFYLASFLGSPIAAAWLFRRNFLTLGNESRAQLALGLGFAATVAVVVLGIYLPKGSPNLLVPILYSYAIYQYAALVFKAANEKHLTNGGRRGSWWMVIGVSLVAVMIIIGVAIAVAFVAPGLFVRK